MWFFVLFGLASIVLYANPFLFFALFSLSLLVHGIVGLAVDIFRAMVDPNTRSLMGMKDEE